MKLQEIREKIAGLVYYSEELIQHIENIGDVPEEVITAIDYIKKNKDEILNNIREQNG